MLTHVHHVNLLVRDLDRMVRRYQEALGLGPPILEEIAGRGVRTARFLLGRTWLVLVQPVDPAGVPAQHLAEHGEGLFLLSFGVESLEAARQSAAQHGATLQGPVREGLAGWRVQDLAPAEFAGAQLQLCEEP